MKLLIIAHEMPYPPTHGGTADMWRRIRALRALGHSLMVVAWAYRGRGQSLAPDHVRRLEAECEKVVILPVDQTPAGFARRLPRLTHLPSHAAARATSAVDLQSITDAAMRFEPDAVWLDGFQGIWLAEHLTRGLDRPLLYRSHNREYVYLTGQRRLARTWKAKLGLLLSTLHLKELERRIHSRAQTVFDISQDDLEAWRAEGFTNGVWLPPLLDDHEPSAAPAGPAVDVAYLGNLRTPNNVQGVLWFLDEVLPRLRQLKPDASVLIGGSTPTEIVRQRCGEAGVELQADAPRPADVLGRGRVLINPVWMTSGVNLKMIDMVATGAPVVTTPPRVTGLPPSVASLFQQAADAEAFARACADSIVSAPADAEARRQAARRWFGQDALKAALDRARIVQ
jgi:hypothetical protein